MTLLHRATAALDALPGVSRAERHAWFVPGRIEVLGKHTDYAGGRSLVCAIERGFVFVAVRRADSRVRMVDASDGSTIEFAMRASGHASNDQPWAVYPWTVARRLSANFGASVGADVGLASDLPPAAGLSSSSAFMIGAFLALADANGLASQPEYAQNIHDTLELASYLATVENGSSFGALIGDAGVGTRGGSEDHTAILCSCAGCVSQYSFAPPRAERLLPMPTGYCFAVASSGIAAEKTGGARDAYNRVAAATHRILEIWRTSTERDDRTLAAALASAPDARQHIENAIDASNDRAFGAAALRARLAQFADESGRIIPAAADALERGDIDSFGTRVDESQHHAERQLGNQVPETIALARSARELGAPAASAFGAGFGGSVWALVPVHAAADFSSRWERSYAAAFPARASAARFFVTSAAQAAHQLF